MVKVKKLKKNAGKKAGTKKVAKHKSGAGKTKSAGHAGKKNVSAKSKKKFKVVKKVKRKVAKSSAGKAIQNKTRKVKKVKKTIHKTKIARKNLSGIRNASLKNKKNIKAAGSSAAKAHAVLKKASVNKKNKVTIGTSSIKKQEIAKGKPLLLNAKPKIDPEEKLHSKTQRIMKELEETMDLEKMKPRIKVPTSTPIKPRHTPVLKLVEPVNTKKEKYQLEFEFRSSKSILYSYLCDSSGMAGWFADEVRSSDNNYTFVWEGSESHAKLVAIKDQLLVRYQWTDENDGTYFQFEIKEDDITSDIALVITDWANPGEKEASARLWESQVQNLRQLIGSV